MIWKLNLLLSGKKYYREDAFKLYDTKRFPIDLTKEILEEKNITIDEAGFNAAMEEQRVGASSPEV